jgi:hypothetical protein
VAVLVEADNAVFSYWSSFVLTGYHHYDDDDDNNVVTSWLRSWLSPSFVRCRMVGVSHPRSTTSSELITAGCCSCCCCFGIPSRKRRGFLGRSDGCRWWQHGGGMVQM